MKGFAIACAAIFSSGQAETYTMEAKKLRTFSNFNGIEVNTKFKMPNENNNLLWMDLKTVFEEPTPE